MIKKVIVLIVLLAFIMPGLLSLAPLGPDSPLVRYSTRAPPQSEGATTYWYNTWYVTGDATYTNQTIILKGNLIIIPPSTLTFVNVTLKMDGATNLSRMIWVQDNAGMVIRDFDNDPTTPGDGSLVTSNNTDGDHRFGFNVSKAKTFTMLNSELSEFGHLGSGSHEYGLRLWDAPAIIKNCTISGCYFGLFLESSSNCIIENNTITNSVRDAIYITSGNYNLIQNNTITTTAYQANGIKFGSGTNNRVVENDLKVSGQEAYGMWFQTTSYFNEIFGNTVNVSGQTGRGLQISADNNNFTKNTVIAWGPAYCGMILQNDHCNFKDNWFESHNCQAVWISSGENNSMKGDRVLAYGAGALPMTVSSASNNNVLENLSMDSTGGFKPALSISQATGIIVTNSTLSLAGVGAEVSSGGKVSLRNCAFTTNQVQHAGSLITVENYLSLNVLDPFGKVVPGTNILIKDKSGATVFNGPPDSRGKLLYEVLTAYVRDMSSTVYDTGHEVTVSAASYQTVNFKAEMNQSILRDVIMWQTGMDGQIRNGDWWVDTLENHADKVFIMNGNITINSTGNLNLQNCIIIMNCNRANGQYGITVRNGGVLHITDGDDDYTTKDDNSEITDGPFDTEDGGAGDYAYYLRVESGGVLEMRNSSVSDCGWNSSEGNEQAVYISGDRAVLDHVDIYSRFGGLRLGTYDSRIENCTITINATYWWSYGIHGWDCTDSLVRNNNIIMFGDQPTRLGMYFGQGARQRIIGNILDIQGAESGWNLGIGIFQGSDFDVSNNDITTDFCGTSLDIYEMDDCTFIGNTITSLHRYTRLINVYNLNNSFADENTLIMDQLANTGVEFSGFLLGTTFEATTITGTGQDNYGFLADHSEGGTVSNSTIDLDGLANVGMLLMPAENLTVYGPEITIGFTDSAGITFFPGSRNCLVEGAVVNTAGESPAIEFNNCADNLVVNSSFSAADWDDVLLYLNSSATLLNCTFSDTQIYEPQTTLYVAWFLDVLVVNETAQPRAGASLDVFDASNSTTFSGITGLDGRSHCIPLEGYVETATGIDNSSNPHRITATDGVISTHETVDMTSGGKTVVIELKNGAPVIDEDVARELTVLEDTFLLHSFQAQDPEGHDIIWNMAPDVDWITFDSGSGELNITPVDEHVGQYDFTLSAIDFLGAFDSIALTVTVENVAPAILTESVVNATEDVFYEVEYDSTDDPNTTWSLDTTQGDWLTIDPVNGTLSGIPLNGNVGNHSVKVSVSDEHGGTTWSNFTLRVVNVNDPPMITGHLPLELDQTVAEGQTLEFNISVLDIDDSPGEIIYNWTLDGDLVSSTDSWSFSPEYEDEGLKKIMVSVSDGSGGSAEISWDVTVTNVNRLPVIEDFEPKTLVLNLVSGDKELHFNITVSDPDGDGLTIIWYVDSEKRAEDTKTFTMVWSDFEPGTYVVSVAVDDGSGNQTARDWTVTVVLDEGSGEEGLPFWAWIIVLVILGLVIIIVVVAVIVVRIRKKPVEEALTSAGEPEEDVVLPSETLQSPDAIEPEVDQQDIFREKDREEARKGRVGPVPDLVAPEIGGWDLGDGPIVDDITTDLVPADVEEIIPQDDDPFAMVITPEAAPMQLALPPAQIFEAEFTQGPKIDEIFIITKTGLLINHFSYKETALVDEDILASMLTVIQNFVKDSFGEKRTALKKLEFGDFNILITPGQAIDVVIISMDKDLEALERPVKSMIGDIERTNANLADWDGASDSLSGIDTYVNELVRGGY